MSKKQQKKIKRLKAQLREEIKTSWANYKSAAHARAQAEANWSLAEFYKKTFEREVDYKIETDLSELDDK